MANRDPHHLTPEEHKKAGTARARRLSADRRRRIASRAAEARWYPLKAQDQRRIEACIDELAAIATEARRDSELKTAIMAIAVIGQFERMKIALRVEEQRMRLGISRGGISDELADRIRGALIAPPDLPMSANGHNVPVEVEFRIDGDEQNHR